MIDAMSWEVLNATADDWESLEQIYPTVCRFGAPASELVVATVIAQLVGVGLMEEMRQRVVDAAAVVADPAEFWFRMTPRGRGVWEANQMLSAAVDAQGASPPKPESGIIAGNGTVVEAAGVYLVFSGDEHQPYRLTKVISIGGAGGAAMDSQLSPSLTPIASPDMWIKLYYSAHIVSPSGPTETDGTFRILPVSANMFLAWGPPKFPIRIGTEAVTSAELAACK